MPLVKNVDETHFLNVDLDMRSRSSLEPIALAMGRKVHVLYVGRERGMHKAYLELYRHSLSADACIRGFCALIRKLPKPERKLWDHATIREFNIGISGQMKPNTYELTVSEDSVKQAADLNARIGITIYSPATKTV